jgi:hypothetical protein
MSKTPLLLALLSLLAPAPAVVAGPPEGPSGRMVQDVVPGLTAEVKRLEKEVARDKSLAEERGHVAAARCELAEVEGDREVLGRELPKVIDYWEARLAALRTLAKASVIPPEEVEQGETAIRKEFRQARQRLDAVKRR